MRTAARTVVLLALVALVACGGGGTRKGFVSPKTSAPDLARVPVPPTIAGLTVERDAKATDELNAAPRKLSVDGAESYAVDGVVYTLRFVQGKIRELKAVLQITRLSDEADIEDKDFRRKIVDQIGRGPIKPGKHGDLLVYARTGISQTIYVWFVGRLMYVLSVRTDRDPGSPAPPLDPQALLADSIKIRPL